MKQSPPIPVMNGSTTPSTAALVTAASIALPPLRSISAPANEASGWLVHTMPSRPSTIERWLPHSGSVRCDSNLIVSPPRHHDTKKTKYHQSSWCLRVLVVNPSWERSGFIRHAVLCQSVQE